MVTIIALMVVLGIVVGYAARQREDLLKTQEWVEELLVENERLRGIIKANESSLEMVLDEIDKSR